MHVGIFSPYIPKHFGGGEKHVLTAAWHLAKQHHVTLLIPSNTYTTLTTALPRYEELVGRPLSSLHWQESPLADRTTSLLQNWRLSGKFELFLYLTDGSFFIPGSKHSILHVQVPFHMPLSWWSRQKLRQWKARNANSKFTQNIVERAWKTPIPFLHTPFVDTTAIPPTPSNQKTKRILAVGRFFDHEQNGMNAKRQDALIAAFRAGCQEHQWDQQGWELHLVGAVEPSGIHAAYVDRLRAQAKGYPISFFHDLSSQQLAQEYEQATFFWHGCGYQVDELQFPERVEHFGMATLEAMARRVVPLVVGKGGQREVVLNQVNGWHWSEVPELVLQTNQAMKLNSQQLDSYRNQARKMAESYSLERFCTVLDEMAHV